MPCDSRYMEPTASEIEHERVLTFFDELVYNPSETTLDGLVARLCLILQNTGVSGCSLEMQIWWRDHQKADKERLERELEEATKAQDKKTALAKLSDYERNLLGY